MPIENRSKTHEEETGRVTSGDGDPIAATGEIVDAAGNSTLEYNDTSDGNVGSAAAETFILTDTPIDEVVGVEVHTNDSSVATGNYISVVEARPAAEADFVSGFQENAILFTLADITNDSEVADDTDISGMEFTYTVKRD